jgi:two-component sensor histidine kinase
MASLSSQIKQLTSASTKDHEWFNLLLNEWQLVADLLSADLVLWLPGRTRGEFIAAAHARPSGSTTIFYRDISGEQVRPIWAHQVQTAFLSGEIIDQVALGSYEGIPNRFSAYPVRRRVTLSQEAVAPEPIAVITRHTNVADGRAPNKVQINYTAAGIDLMGMIAEGTFPDFGNPTGPKRGAPRANDGLLRIGTDGTVQFASPNGLSVFNGFGVQKELEGQRLSQLVTPLILGGNSKTVDESLPLVLEGKAPWRADLESKHGTITLRSVPLKSKGERIGALLLCRDVTELRNQERELITKDATIREIHHRVKNNLQTVASLLRMQARRSKSPEAKESLEQAMRRVAAIAVVHDTLSSGLSQDVNFDEVFERVMSLASELAASHGTTVKTQKDGKFGPLRSEAATTLAVVLTELVTNAVEHGLAQRSGLVAVHAERGPKKLEITVADNGRGLDNGGVGNGLGTQIVRTLVEGELRGSIRWYSPSEGGTRAVVSMPL